VAKFELQQTVTYRWWSDEEIPEQALSHLEEHALERSHDMIKDGFICGELNVEIVCGAWKPITKTFRGWWEFTTKKIEDSS
jgi:hypothetical protein